MRKKEATPGASRLKLSRQSEPWLLPSWEWCNHCNSATTRLRPRTRLSTSVCPQKSGKSPLIRALKPTLPPAENIHSCTGKTSLFPRLGIQLVTLGKGLNRGFSFLTPLPSNESRAWTLSVDISVGIEKETPVGVAPVPDILEKAVPG
jgi:biotin synthase-related radical SAM superfamily protein